MTARARHTAAPGLYHAAPSARGRVAQPRPVAAWFAVLLLRGLALLPFPAIYRIGGALGRIGASLPLRPVRFAATTIRMCLPSLSARDRGALVRRSTAESIRAICELGALWTWDRDRVLGLVREVRGGEHFDAAIVGGRGVILVSPHLGSWELLGLYCSARHPIASLYTRPAATLLERFYETGRARFGARLVPATAGGMRALVRALADGQSVGIIPDQDPRGGAGVFVPFFGVLANTTTLVSRLAQQTGAPVVLAYAERLPHGAGFRLHFSPASRAVYEPDVAVSAGALNLDIERLVRACPEQYLWSYRRFRVRPDGEANPYTRSADA